MNKVRNLLTRYGFHNVWCNESQINETHFISIFIQRLIDKYLQQWEGNNNDNGVLTLYRELKTSFEFESYLDNIVSRTLRIAITKLRICSHNLRIHTGRYDRLERNVRLCQVCDSTRYYLRYSWCFFFLIAGIGLNSKLNNCSSSILVRHKQNIHLNTEYTSKQSILILIIESILHTRFRRIGFRYNVP